MERILNTNKVLRLKNICHSFGDKKVLNNISLEILQGQIVALVGPSGCGKSTLLKAILGTHPPTSGSILINDKEHTSPSRNVGIVYQDYKLVEFLPVVFNVALGLKLFETTMPFRTFRYFSWKDLEKRHIRKSEILLDKVGLSDHLSMLPKNLSGGQKQRVAIAQALIMEPEILLLDEPFGALDEATREELQDMLLQLYQENIKAANDGEDPPVTILIVTHEQKEAFIVSDRVLGLSQYYKDGKNGSAILFDEPAPVFLPGFDREQAIFGEQRDRLKKVF